MAKISGLETRYKRLLSLEEEKNGQEVDLTEKQIKLLAVMWKASTPEYFLCQDTFMVGGSLQVN